MHICVGSQTSTAGEKSQYSPRRPGRKRKRASKTLPDDLRRKLGEKEGELREGVAQVVVGLLFFERAVGWEGHVEKESREGIETVGEGRRERERKSKERVSIEKGGKK